jgi:hypothetical protein
MPLGTGPPQIRETDEPRRLHQRPGAGTRRLATLARRKRGAAAQDDAHISLSAVFAREGEGFA